MTRTPWQQILALAVYGRIMTERWATVCREQAPTGTFHLGQRVRITVDDITEPPGRFHAKTGMPGVIAHMPTQWDPDYAVVLDEDPSGRRRAYGENELTPAA